MEIKDIEKLAELAKIELTQEEKEHLLSDMESSLGYVKQIQEVDLPAQEFLTLKWNIKIEMFGEKMFLKKEIFPWI